MHQFTALLLAYARAISKRATKGQHHKRFRPDTKANSTCHFVNRFAQSRKRSEGATTLRLYHRVPTQMG
jgi:hypothetical protein